MSPARTAPGAASARRWRVVTLALLVPVLLAAVAWGYLSAPVPGGPGGRAWPLAMLAAGAVAGAAMLLWRAVRPRSGGGMPAAEAVPPSPAAPASDRRQSPQPGDVESLLDSFSRMLSTIEQQAVEINRYAERLDSAYREIESSNARLKEFSFKDEVTGLYNRRFFSIRLEEEVSRYRRFNHPVSVVLIDLDGFKEINDELGHPAGDETLRGMAEILLRHSRGINVICRYGGDEFAILLVETSKGGARLYADRIRYVLPGHRFAHGRRVSASFGIASLPEDVTPAPDALIRAADEALYAAKRAGKNRVSVYEDIRPPSHPDHPARR
jgi:diguanylate cyclase (GGDEF)-like protein